MELVKDSKITLVSYDSTRASIDEKSAEKSILIKDYSKDFPNAEIYLNNIDGETLSKIIEYLEHYKEE